jgi:hypothetical protein
MFRNNYPQLFGLNAEEYETLEQKLVLRNRNYCQGGICMEQAFLPGTLSCSEAVANSIDFFILTDLLTRHVDCDFGEIPAYEVIANHDAILQGGFVVSLYSVGIAERIVVKTELANRVTKVIFERELEV